MSRTLRNKKNYHAVAKGREPKLTGIYIDYSRMEKAISGTTLSVYSSEATLDDAVAFMQANGVPVPSVFVFGSDGVKHEYSVEKYRLSSLHPDMSQTSKTIEQDVLSQDLFDSDDDVTFNATVSQHDSLLQRVQASPVVSKIKDTLKSLQKSITTPAKSSEPSRFTHDILADTLNDSRESTVIEKSPLIADSNIQSFVTSTPFRSEPTGHTQDIKEVSVIPVIQPEIEQNASKKAPSTQQSKTEQPESDENASKKAPSTQQSRTDATEKAQGTQHSKTKAKTLTEARSKINAEEKQVKDRVLKSDNKHDAKDTFPSFINVDPDLNDSMDKTESNRSRSRERTSSSRSSSHSPKRIYFKFNMPKKQRKYSVLSNMKRYKCVFRGEDYESNEHAYQYTKAIHHKDQEKADEILRTKDPFRAKAIGNKIKENDSWREIKFGIMLEINRGKLDNCSDFADVLLSTEGYELFEDTDHKDWGGQEGGANWLGLIMHNLRDELRLKHLIKQMTSFKLPNPQKESPSATDQPPAEQPEKSATDAPQMESPTATKQPQESATDTQKPGLNVKAEPFVSSALPKRKVLVLGDSRSQGIHPRIKNSIVITVPRPGEKVGQAVDIVPHIVDKATSDVVLVYGTNDVLATTPEKFRADYLNLVCAIQNVNPNVNIICVGIFKRHDMGNKNAKANACINQFNEIIREMGHQFVDTTTNSAGQQIYTKKMLHLDLAGQYKLSQSVRNALVNPNRRVVFTFPRPLLSESFNPADNTRQTSIKEVPVKKDSRRPKSKPKPAVERPQEDKPHTEYQHHEQKAPTPQTTTQVRQSYPVPPPPPQVNAIPNPWYPPTQPMSSFGQMYASRTLPPPFAPVPNYQVPPPTFGQQSVPSLYGYLPIHQQARLPLFSEVVAPPHPQLIQWNRWN